MQELSCFYTTFSIVAVLLTYKVKELRQTNIEKLLLTLYHLFPGSMQLILAWSANDDEVDYAQVPRIKPEAEGCYEPHRGKRMEK